MARNYIFSSLVVHTYFRRRVSNVFGRDNYSAIVTIHSLFRANEIRLSDKTTYSCYLYYYYCDSFANVWWLRSKFVEISFSEQQRNKNIFYWNVFRFSGFFFFFLLSSSPWSIKRLNPYKLYFNDIAVSGFFFLSFTLLCVWKLANSGL